MARVRRTLSPNDVSECVDLRVNSALYSLQMFFDNYMASDDVQ